MHLHPVNPTVKPPARTFTGDVWMTPVFGGDDVSPAGEEHRHSETPAEDATVWLEPVTDEQYAAANAGA